MQRIKEAALSGNFFVESGRIERFERRKEQRGSPSAEQLRLGGSFLQRVNSRPSE
jgi:hypothetical protein